MLLHPSSLGTRWFLPRAAAGGQAASGTLLLVQWPCPQGWDDAGDTYVRAAEDGTAMDNGRPVSPPGIARPSVDLRLQLAFVYFPMRPGLFITSVRYIAPAAACYDGVARDANEDPVCPGVPVLRAFWVAKSGICGRTQEKVLQFYLARWLQLSSRAERPGSRRTKLDWFNVLLV